MALSQLASIQKVHTHVKRVHRYTRAHTYTHMHTFFVRVNGIKTDHTKLKSIVILSLAGSECDREVFCRMKNDIHALTQPHHCRIISVRVPSKFSGTLLHTVKRGLGYLSESYNIPYWLI